MIKKKFLLDSSTPQKMTQKVVHEETKAKQFFVGGDA
jgi:hypothetical protein